MKPRTASGRPRVFSISKRLLLAVLGCLGLLAQRSQAATCNYTIAIPQDWSMIANQCDNPSGNTLNNVFPVVPAGSKMIKWNNQVQAWGPISIFSGGIWSPNQMLDPGEGAFFFNPGAPFNLNVSGNPHTPVLPLVLPPNGCCIVSRQEPLTGGFMDIIGLPPQDGDAVWQYQSPQGIYLQDVYFEVLGGWSGDSGGNEPMASVGESVWICRGGNPSQPPECDPIVITQQPTNTSVTVSTNMTNCVTFSVAATGTAPLGYQWCSNGVPIAGAINSS